MPLIYIKNVAQDYFYCGVGEINLNLLKLLLANINSQRSQTADIITETSLGQLTNKTFKNAIEVVEMA